MKSLNICIHIHCISIDDNITELPGGIQCNSIRLRSDRVWQILHNAGGSWPHRCWSINFYHCSFGSSCVKGKKKVLLACQRYLSTKFTIWIWNCPLVRFSPLISDQHQCPPILILDSSCWELCQKSWPQKYFPPGIIPRSIVHIFEGKTAEEDEDTMYDVRVSYIEIYNEEIRLSYFYIFPYVLFLRFIWRSTMRGLGQFSKLLAWSSSSVSWFACCAAKQENVCDVRVHLIMRSTTRGLGCLLYNGFLFSDAHRWWWRRKHVVT